MKLYLFLLSLSSILIMTNDRIKYEIKTDYSTPSSGDIFKFDNTYLLVTRNFGSMYNFAPLNGEEQADIESTLTGLSLNFHREEPTATEKLLQSVIGGNKPTGYFGFTIEKKLFNELQENDLDYICTIILDDLKITEIGGTSAPDKASVKSVINRCLAFQMGERVSKSLSELSK